MSSQDLHPAPRTTRRKQGSNPVRGESDELMGSILRRKAVASLPIGSKSEFWNDLAPIPAEGTYTAGDRAQLTPQPPRRPSNPNIISGILRRKQVSLDLRSAHEQGFFAATPSVPEVLEPAPEDGSFEEIQEEEEEDVEEGKEERKEVKLFRPLRFAPKTVDKSGGGGRGPHHGGDLVEEIDEETRLIVEKQVETNQVLKMQLKSLYSKIDGVDNEFLQDIRKTQEDMERSTDFLEAKLLKRQPVGTILEEGEEGDEIEKVAEEDEIDSGIIKASKKDLRLTTLLAVIMTAFIIMICTWNTHLDETALIRSPVGVACATPCLEQSFFEEGQNTFKSDEFIELLIHWDPHHHTEAKATVKIVGIDSGVVKATVEFGPPDEERRITEDEIISTDFENPGEEHRIEVTSSNATVTLTFTLHTNTLTSLANYSVLIAAIVLVCTYLFILLEVIHRTLVAIYGSMVALFFVFLIHGGKTASIASVMLYMEWSTLGLLFGMMIIVGELSHTGIFEWFAVRLLVSSKGSFHRLMLLLCTLTAVASAFLDNVTTMLLVAPVTIDMCKILDVDPRPYLIGEVILSNIGGTATLIGDPPNIIIGTSIEGIDFVDFIINIAPCVFIFLIPVALVMIMWIYKHYLTAFTMPVLDATQLKKTYPIYDEPRLLIAGTVAFFVILSFFLHPIHHKDTAWIAIIGALLTITFTNPHDVQDALRNHIEWDTLLFFAGLFVLIEACAELGLLDAIGKLLSDFISAQPESSQLPTAITVIMWVSAIASAFIDNIPWTATMIPIIKILADDLDTLPLTTLAWALSFGACLGGNGTLLGASANIVTAGIATNKGYNVSFLNFLYPGFAVMIVTVAIANLYMLVVYVWV
jgi:Na+/H+ antiporter NhaD/arsenite permease-like protein